MTKFHWEGEGGSKERPALIKNFFPKKVVGEC